ncbi:MAG: hypothetical protein OEW08_06260 [Gammaproteobacteria bacterium]|nr:hypothetical protein [Gammaproteobacteria bacterium]
MSEPKVRVVVTLDGKQYVAELDRAEKKTQEFSAQTNRSAAEVAHLERSMKTMNGEVESFVRQSLSMRNVLSGLGIGTLAYEVVNLTGQFGEWAINAMNAVVQTDQLTASVNGLENALKKMTALDYAKQVKSLQAAIDQLGASNPGGRAQLENLRDAALAHMRGSNDSTIADPRVRELIVYQQLKEARQKDTEAEGEHQAALAKGWLAAQQAGDGAEAYGQRMAVLLMIQLGLIDDAETYGKRMAELAREAYPEATMSAEEYGKAQDKISIKSLAAREHIAAQMQSVREAMYTEEQALSNSYAQRAEIVGNALQQGIIDEKQAKEELLLLENDYQKRRNLIAKKAEDEQLKMRLEGVATVAGSFSFLTSVFAHESRQAFKIYQAFAIAESSINTYQAYTKALATIPPPFNYAAAAAVLAAGAAKVHQIGAMSPGGGVSGGGGATPIYPVSPISGLPDNSKQGGGATSIYIQGPIYGFDDFRDRVTDAVKDAVDNRDVVIISGNSRQAAELRQ